MLLENQNAQNIAREQANLGVQLAHQANDALTQANQTAAARNAALDASMGHPDYRDVMSSQEGARTEAAAHYAHFGQLAAAAGELIGRHSLGGEYLSIQNGNAPTIHSDGSYQDNSHN